MKIVINSCYGGFGLSHKAIMAYAKRKGFKLYPWASVPKEMEIKESEVENHLFVHYTKVPLIEYKKQSQYANKNYFSARDIKRTDPDLIDVVKKLGDEANGKCADLKIIEIPEGIKYEISEYDGIETVKEAHKSWG